MAQALSSAAFADNTHAVCIGSGRFLRAVLVPTLRAMGSRVVLLQPRGSDFVDFARAAKGKYEVDTVQRDGRIHTDVLDLDAVGSLSVAADRAAFLELPSKLPNLKFVGLGVTESGFVDGSQAIADLAEFLLRASQALPDNELSVINTDNVPANGDAIKRLVQRAAWASKPTTGSPEAEAFASYLATKVVFHNTMVDRITSHRDGQPLVPKTEPWPTKTLVIEDLTGVLSSTSLASQQGVVVRSTQGELTQDHTLKLSVANAVHTALVYLLALSRVPTTQAFSASLPTVRIYVDALFEKDILPAMVAQGISTDAALAAYDEWIARVDHPHFGLDPFWISQNAMFKYGVRLFSSVAVNAANDPTYRPSVFMAFATAVLLRFLTPTQDDARRDGPQHIFVGNMDAIQQLRPDLALVHHKTWTYANGLTANLSTGKYEFLDGATGRVATLLRRASEKALDASKSSSHSFTKPKNATASAETAAVVGVAVATALSTVEAFDLTHETHAAFASDVAALYQRLIEGKETLGRTALVVLDEISRAHTASEYLTTRDELAAFVREAVATVQIIDVHTHLFPPSHGQLVLWGVNELLTYHYLVAEYMMTAPIEIEEFNTFSKAKQAQLIWQHLFIDRLPISEACRGVVTTLRRLGLGELVKKRDLAAIQAWFAAQDPDEYVDTVFRVAGLKYVVMTNIPFEPEEARHWLGDPVTGTPPPKWSRKYFRSALRVDQVLLGDWKSIGPALDEFALPHTMDGVRTYLEKWIEIMQPEYFMASVPSQFRYPDANVVTPAGDKASGADLLLQVLLPLAETQNLPIALKFDSVRPLNARLGVAGDGVKPSDVDILVKLCRHFPKVKFLATYLSRVNQHEVTIAANKFRNLHLYGCWWYCNNPSIIDEMTRQRIEILGTAFTSQHSDARVLDQLVYKWSHSREVIGDVLVDMYDKMAVAGWQMSKSELRRDIYRLFGGSYEEFMAKTP